MEDMGIKGFLNEEQAEELFHREAVLIKNDDAIPAARAVQLLGATPVSYAMVQHKSDHLLLHRVYTNETTLVNFLTWPGFSLAVTYHSAILQAEKENPRKEENQV